MAWTFSAPPTSFRRAPTRVRRPLVTGSATVLLALSLSGVARAQDPASDPPETAKGHLGPLTYSPALRFDFGLDSNVFNAASDVRQDAAAVTAPSVDAWLRVGRMRVQTSTNLGFVYFFRFASERSVNARNEVRISIPLNRVRFYAGNVLLTSRDRVNLDLDARARRYELRWAGGADVRITPKTTIGAAVHTSRVTFADGGDALTNQVRAFLNRDVTTLSASVRRAVTPLTTILVTGESRRERFSLLPARNSDSVALLPGVAFDKFALLRGHASLGYRSFRPLNPTIPDYRGVVASADLEYTLKTTTRFNFLAQRDVDYSVESELPYFLLTGATGTVTHMLSDAWQIQATIGRDQLAYQSILPAGVPQSAAFPLAGRVDSVVRFGGGLGYRVGPGTIIGLNVDQYRRTSAVGGRNYDDLRVSTSVIYRD